MTQRQLVVGCGLPAGTPLTTALDFVAGAGFDFTLLPLSQALPAQSNGLDVAGRAFVGAEPWTQTDQLLPSQQWSLQVCGVVNESIPGAMGGAAAVSTAADQAKTPAQEASLCTNQAAVAIHSGVRAAVELFRREMAWAVHLSFPCSLVPLPERGDVAFSREINRIVQSNLSYVQMWVRIPLITSQEEVEAEMDSAISISSTNTDTRQALQSAGSAWHRWNQLRTLCDSHSNLFAALELTADLPSETILAQWLGEPVRCVIIPVDIFKTSSGGNPVLGPAHQSFVSCLMLRNVQIILDGVDPDAAGSTGAAEADFEAHLEYVRFLHRRTWGSLTLQHQYESPYWDYLQSPLQPLMDNLESQTYETFERDTPKYAMYQEAIRRYLEDTPTSKLTVLMVVGAGRGPLVKCSLAAAALAKRTLKVFAVEKNPNAVVTLRHMHGQLKWGETVTIIDSDMRTWQTNERADVLVSELLGSFGDNELSPECLDGAQKFLAPTGVSIPSTYTSYLAPLSSEKLWTDVRHMGSSGSADGSGGRRKALETGYVVRFHNATLLAEPQACFQFHHPNHDVHSVQDNERYTKIAFVAAESSMLHGFAGFFDSDLYKDVSLSILPRTHTPSMSSWFPIFWPLVEPVYVEAGQEIEVHWWRCTDGRKVWYEWALAQPTATIVHNVGGRSSWIGL